LDPKDPKKKRKDAYRRFAKKLREGEQKTEETGQKILQQRLETFQKTLDTLIAPPAELVAKTLLVKKIAGFPPTLEGFESFQEPKRMGKSEFRARLAIDMISYGIHTQRIRGGLLTIDSFTETFLRDRHWWDTSPETVQQMFRTLAEEGIVTITATEDIIFEPIELSQEIGQILILADRKGVLAIEEICSQFNWTENKVEFILKQLENEGIVIYDMIEQLYYFPALASQRTDAHV